MTKEQRADALLCAARDWQNVNLTNSDVAYLWRPIGNALVEAEPLCPVVLDVWASAALCEVAGMGYELENADGTPTEKVAEVESDYAASPVTGYARIVYKLRQVKP